MNASNLRSDAEPRLHLAIETSGRLGSLALVDSSDPVAPAIIEQRMLPGKVRTATSITPEIRDLLQGRKVQWVSVARGPGSFTGLRIGVTTAKTLAFGWQAQLIAVDSLAAVASAAFENDPKSTAVWVAVNAYRGQVFAGSFRNSSLRAEMDPMTLESELRSIGESKVFSADEWAAILLRLAQDDSSLRLAGDRQCFEPIEGYAERFIERSCDAVGVAVLAHHAAWRNEFCDPLGLVPSYLKPSAAEEKKP